MNQIRSNLSVTSQGRKDPDSRAAPRWGCRPHVRANDVVLFNVAGQKEAFSHARVALSDAERREGDKFWSAAFGTPTHQFEKTVDRSALEADPLLSDVSFLRGASGFTNLDKKLKEPLEGTKRSALLRHLFGADPAFADWLRVEAPSLIGGSPREIWFTVGNPKKNPEIDFDTLSIGQSIEWQVPRGAGPGSLVLFYISRLSEFRYLTELVSPLEEDDGKHYAVLRILHRMERPVTFADLKEDGVLGGWGPVTRQLQDGIARQDAALNDEPRVWAALGALLVAADPSVEVFLPLAVNLPQKSKEAGRITQRRDDAERDHDSLGRSSLAVSLAWTLHEVWCNGLGLAPFSKRSSHDDAAGFVAQIDAPWGGGKTSFANLVTCTLNPGFLNEPPAFLKALYPERDELHGLFISSCHELGNLRDRESGEYLWEERARRPWIIVPFNAWQNQHVDPPWWSFYQTIRKTCVEAVGNEGTPTVEQTEDGSYQCRSEGWFTRTRRWSGLWFRELTWRLLSPAIILKLSVGSVAALTALLSWWFSFDLGLVVALLTGIGAFISAIVSVLADALVPGQSSLSERIFLGSVDPLARFRAHYKGMIELFKRPILVVIDDIDRCEPKFIVEMTRGLQTILTSPRVVYLLLGDRKWIEKAFEVYHQDMKGIDLGPEHSFGGRFVEKAIQLQFILPGIGESKETYVREVLMGQDIVESEKAKEIEPAEPGNGASSDPITPEVGISVPDPAQIRMRQQISDGISLEEIDAVGANLLSAEDVASQELQRTIVSEVVLGRSAHKYAVEEQISHSLQPIAKFLPENPRHIKRIINAVSMYQNSILLIEKDFEQARFGGGRWRELVVGVVLMIGFPKSWALLAANPKWADDLIERLDTPSSPPDADDNAVAAYGQLKGNEAFVGLIRDAELRSTDGSELIKTPITMKAVKHLNQLFPTLAGQETADTQRTLKPRN